MEQTSEISAMSERMNRASGLMQKVIDVILSAFDEFMLIIAEIAADDNRWDS